MGNPFHNNQFEGLDVTDFSDVVKVKSELMTISSACYLWQQMFANTIQVSGSSSQTRAGPSCKIALWQMK